MSIKKLLLLLLGLCTSVVLAQAQQELWIEEFD